MAFFSEKLSRLTSQNDIEMVYLINENVVGNAIRLMKHNKSDVSNGFCSNALKQGPAILHKKLAEIFRSWLCHGRVTMSILALSLLPLVKGLKSPSNTNNYRLIAGTSLILKLFERVILLIWGPGIINDDLQSGFRENVGASQCTWLIQETLNYYLRGEVSHIWSA